ncbi:hypothetical protein [Amycolatopsis sp. NPDC003861]
MSGAYLLQVAKPPAPTVVAGHGLAASREQLPSAPGGAIAHREPTRISPADERVPEPRAPAVTAFARGRVLVACRERAIEPLAVMTAPAAVRPLSPFPPGRGLGADELWRARAYLPLVAGPTSPVLVAWRELVAFQERTVKPLGTPGITFVGKRGPATFPEQAVEPSIAFIDGRVPMPAVREQVAA